MADCACRCVDGGDLGMNEYASCIASLDPVCQHHNRHEYAGDAQHSCSECGEPYRVHAVHHEFVPAFADEDGMVHCGVCNVRFDAHRPLIRLDRWNAESERVSVSGSEMF